MSKERLGFSFRRKRIKKDKKMPPLCRDYKSEEDSDNCEKSKFCKNATYSMEGTNFGICYGGTKSSEREDRTRRTHLRSRK